MLHTLLLVCCLNQFTVTVEKPLQSFTVQVDEPKQEEYSDYYVVMFTASWCGPCRNYKQTGKLDKIINGGTRVVLVDIDTNNSYYSGSIPKFWICRNKVRVHEFPAGAVAPEVILKKVKDLSESKPVEVKKTSSSVYNGRPNNSHTNRDSLIDHLLNGVVHRGRHTKVELDRLSDTELDKLHSLDHNTK
jgi:thiol-disulfide isomerase/thioredoxin